MGVRINTIDVWRVALSMIGSGTPISALQIASAILGVIEGDGQSETVSRIDKNVEKLIKLHIEAGRDHLKNAVSAADPGIGKQWLLQALNSFINAKNVEAPPENIRAMTYVAACFQCLGDEPLASEWYKDSYAAALARREGLISRINRLKSDVVIYIAIAILFCWTLIAPLIYFVYWRGRIIKELNSSLTELFDIERQMIQLDRILSARGLSSTLPDLFFPSYVVSVQEWSILLDGDNTGTPVLFSFDEQERIVSCIHLTNGKPIPPSRITGSFRRKGKHLVFQWRTWQ